MTTITALGVTITIETIDTVACDQCGWTGEPQELTPDHNGDPICSDCQQTNADINTAYRY